MQAVQGTLAFHRQQQGRGTSDAGTMTFRAGVGAEEEGPPGMRVNWLPSGVTQEGKSTLCVLGGRSRQIVHPPGWLPRASPHLQATARSGLHRMERKERRLGARKPWLPQNEECKAVSPGMVQPGGGGRCM